MMLIGDSVATACVFLVHALLSPHELSTLPCDLNAVCLDTPFFQRIAGCLFLGRRPDLPTNSE